MDLDAMRALLAAVEAGEWSAEAFANSGPAHTDLTWKAFQGDMNAALAIHGALLPGWAAELTIFPSMCFALTWPDEPDAYENSRAREALTPARALLIATLQGVVAKMGAAA